MTSKKYQTVCYSVTPSDHANLIMLAKEHDLSASAMLRYLIKMAIEARDEQKRDAAAVSNLLTVA